MNEHSVICKFIKEHPEDWEQILHKDYDIRIKKEDSYAIFVYNVTCNFYDPIVQEARGIIIDFEKREVVCWPFRKFGNYNEGYADKIDWNNAKVLEKVDGSIIKLWYDFKKGDWQFSTNGTIRAENANVDGCMGLTYATVIKQADNFYKIPYDSLDKNCTYIFELVSRETRVVIDYKGTSLYHLGSRNNLTGEEFEVDIGIKKPKAYKLNSLNDCINAANALNQQNENSEEVENEGFVVVDKNYNRVKIKSPDYIMMHKVKSMTNLKKDDCLNVILYESERMQSIFDNCPEIVPVIKFYEYHLAELKLTANRLANFAKSLMVEYSGDRRAVAQIILKHPLSVVAFRALDNGTTGEQELLKVGLKLISKNVPEYQKQDFFAVFNAE